MSLFVPFPLVGAEGSHISSPPHSVAGCAPKLTPGKTLFIFHYDEASPTMH